MNHKLILCAEEFLKCHMIGYTATAVVKRLSKELKEW